MKSFGLSWSLVIALLGSGCLAYEVDSNELGDEGEGSESNLQDSSGQLPLTPAQLSGNYLYVVSTVLAPAIPTVYLAQVEAVQAGRGLSLHMRQRPLSKTDRATPVGPWGPWRRATLSAAGEFESNAIRTVVPSAANALTGLDTETEIAMTGEIANPRTTDEPQARVPFFCGALSGRIVSPIPVDDLSGSTFTATRIAQVNDPSSYPPVVINCNKTPARALVVAAP